MEFQPILSSVSPPTVAVVPGQMVATEDGTLWVDTSDGRISFSGLVPCATIADRDAIPTNLWSKGKLYCVTHVGDKTDILYRWSGNAFVEVSKQDPPIVQLPNMAAYEVLSDVEKNNGTLYLIEGVDSGYILEAANDTVAMSLSQSNPGNIYFVAR